MVRCKQSEGVLDEGESHASSQGKFPTSRVIFPSLHERKREDGEGVEGRVGGVCYTHSQVGHEWKRSGCMSCREDPRI
jgi:hypothetical protein